MKEHFKEVKFQKGAFSPRDFPVPSLPEVAFLGRSNVGKSSLINAFLRKRRLARVSSTPGFTRAINFFRVDHRFLVVDLPGYGFARVPLRIRQQWKVLVESYLSAPRPIKLLVLIFDVRRKPDELDRALLEYVTSLGRRFIVVLNKIDRLKKTAWLQALKTWQEGLTLSKESLFLTSCKEGWGINEVRREILKALKE